MNSSSNHQSRQEDVRFEAERDSCLETLLETHEKKLINYLYKYLGSLHDAEDAAQHAFIKTYLNIRKCPTPESMSGYLYKTATNAALNILRRKRILKIFSLSGGGDEADFTAAELPDTASMRPEDAYNDSQRQKRVRRALSSLPHEQKTALLLSFYDDKSYAEIAAILGKSRSAVESLIFRAKQNLTELLKNIED